MFRGRRGWRVRVEGDGGSIELRGGGSTSRGFREIYRGWHETKS